MHGYDLIVYLSVFYFFISLLLLGVKQRARKWSVWFLDIKVIKDAEVRNWYFQNRADEDKETLMELTYPKSLKVSREALLKEILQSLKKWPLRQKTVDPFVARLAKSYRANLFLLASYMLLFSLTASLRITGMVLRLYRLSSSNPILIDMERADQDRLKIP